MVNAFQYNVEITKKRVPICVKRKKILWKKKIKIWHWKRSRLKTDSSFIKTSGKKSEL